MKFIRLTKDDGTKALVNTSDISCVLECNDKNCREQSVVYFAEQEEYIKVLESIDSIENLIGATE